MNKILVGIIGLLVLGAGGLFILRMQTGSPTSQTSQTPTQPSTGEEITGGQFSTPKKSSHYESNTPEHGVVLAGAPVNVVIDFNFDLAKGSEIKIESGGQDYAVLETVIDANKLVMRRKMDANAPDGLYTVSYKACWADGSCHDGMFQFKVDRTKAADFIDMTGKKELVINIQNFAFSPAKIKVSKGTKVTWTNQDSVVHTVNTDAHPAHTYYLDQNSKDLKKGNQYSVTFNDLGIYLYHCTPHASSMHGQILVE